MQYATIKEASQILKLSRQYIWQICRQGRLPYQRIGKMFVIDKRILLHYLSETEKEKNIRKERAEQLQNEAIN